MIEPRPTIASLADVDQLNAAVAHPHVRVAGVALSPSVIVVALVAIDDLDWSSQQRAAVVVGGTLALMLLSSRAPRAQQSGAGLRPTG